MPQITVELTTDAFGVVNRTVVYNPPGPFSVTVGLSGKLASPFATGLWASLDIEPKNGRRANRRRAFVAWQGEQVQLGSWHLDGGDNLVVVRGITQPKRPNARLVLQIDAAI